MRRASGSSAMVSDSAVEFPRLNHTLYTSLVSSCILFCVTGTQPPKQNTEKIQRDFDLGF